MSAWSEAFSAVRARWPRAYLRVTMLAEQGPQAFCALAVQPTTTGSGADDVASAFGPSDEGALRELVETLRARHAPRPAP